MEERFYFGRYELRPQTHQLYRNGVMVHARPRALEVLQALALAKADGKDTVTTDWLLQKVWNEASGATSAGKLRVHISELRQLLDPDLIEYAERGHGRGGWRLTQPVRRSRASAVHHNPVLTTRVHEFASGRSSPTWLCAAPDSQASAVVRWQSLAREAVAEVSRHGGTLEPPSGDVFVACLATSEAALDCSRWLHRLMARSAQEQSVSELRVVLHPVLADHRDSAAGREFAARLVADIPAGQTWFAEELPYIDKIDGDASRVFEDDSGQQILPDGFLCLKAPLMHTQDTAPTRAHPRLRPMVAVIPFDASTGSDDSGEPLGNILAQELTAVLQRSELIKVISYRSAMQFVGRKLTVRQIARALAADYVVVGDYRCKNARIDVRAEVADGSTDEAMEELLSVGSQRDAGIGESPLVQTLAKDIVKAVVQAELPKTRSAPLPDLPSHTLLLTGVSLMYRMALGDFMLAYDALHTLRERVPRHATPLAWLSRWHMFRLAQGWSTDKQLDGVKALEYARRAIDIDSDSSLALAMMGCVETTVHQNLNGALDYFERALQIDPNESIAHLQRGNTLSFANRGSEGLASVEEAIRLSPIDPARHHYLALLAGAALSANRLDAAISATAKALILNPRHLTIHRIRTISLALNGQSIEARQAAAKLMHLQPRLTVSSFVADSPGEPSLVMKFAQALREAGVPD